MSEENNAPVEAEETVVEQTEEIADESAEIESEDEVVEGEEESAATPQEQAEVKRALKEYELKVNGKSKKISVDLDDEEGMKSMLQKAAAADEKFQEAAHTKKQMDQLLYLLQNDPISLLKNPHLKHNIKELAEQVLLQDLEEQAKSPEQKRIEELEAQVKKIDEEKKRKEDESAAARLEEATKKHREEIETSMINALNASDLPPEPYFIRRVADAMQSFIEAGWEDVTIEQVMPYVEKRLKDDFGSLVGKHKEPSKLEKLLGKNVLDDYRKHNIAKLKKAPPMKKVEDTSKTPVAPVSTAPKKMRIDDMGGW